MVPIVCKFLLASQLVLAVSVYAYTDIVTLSFIHTLHSDLDIANCTCNVFRSIHYV